MVKTLNYNSIDTDCIIKIENGIIKAIISFFPVLHPNQWAA